MTGGNPFGKEDLYLFIDSHKNMVELHTLVLSQLQVLIESNKQLNKKSDQVIESMNALTTKVGEFVEKAGQIQVDIAQAHAESTKAHEEIKNNIYVGWVGMASIVILIIATFLL
jgi:hypothetical protein